MRAFRSYISPGNGKDQIQDWYQSLPPGAQAEFDIILQFLEVRPNGQWGQPPYKPLGGKQRGMGEIRLSHGKIVYRVFGFFGVPQMTFTMVIGAQKKMNSYIPANALNTAVTRRKDVQSGKALTNVWTV